MAVAHNMAMWGMRFKRNPVQNSYPAKPIDINELPETDTSNLMNVMPLAYLLSSDFYK
jgi:hypothetical protein